MKIAFTSCIDAIDDPQQEVWARVKQQSPDVLLLLGDTMYMDYLPGLLFSDRPLGWPRKEPIERFAVEMHSRYRRQWAVDNFRDLLASGVRLGMIWDDHDFAWNDARGLGKERKFAVSREQRLVAQGLFRQFRDTCARPHDPAYPPMPTLNALLEGPEQGIQQSFDHGGVRFIMTDGRSYREDPDIETGSSLLGQAQRDWVVQQLTGWDGLVVLGSGNVLTGSKEAWARYRDYAWLLGLHSRRMIALTGDIHKNVLPTQHGDFLVEVTASGAARPGFGGARGNFGMLAIGESISATLFSRTEPGGVEAAVRFGA